MSVTRRNLLHGATGLFAAAAFGGPLTGCGDAPKDLNYQTWMMGEPGVKDYWTATIDGFKKANPGVNVSLTNTPVNAYEDKVSAQIAAGDVPDILPVFLPITHISIRHWRA